MAEQSADVSANPIEPGPLQISKDGPAFFQMMNLMEPSLTECSADVADLVAALSKAQGAFHEIPKNKTGKVRGTTTRGQSYEYEYKYADIADVLRVCRPVLSSNGLAVVQLSETKGKAVTVTTMLMHGNQWIRTTITANVPDSRGSWVQELGKIITYLRRYALCAMIGVQAEEDVDATQTPTDPWGDERPSVATPSQNEGCITQEQIKELTSGMGITGMALKDLVKHLAENGFDGIATPRDIPTDAFDIAKAFVSKAINQKENS